MIITQDIWNTFQWPEWFIQKWGEHLHFETIEYNKYYGGICSKFFNKKIGIKVILDDIIKVIKEYNEPLENFRTVFLENYGIKLYEISNDDILGTIKMVFIRKFDHKFYSFISTEVKYKLNEEWIQND